MIRRSFQKFSMVLFAAFLVFSAFGNVASAADSGKDLKLPVHVKHVKKTISKSLKKHTQDNYKPTDQVRVIVEMKDQPTIAVAQKQKKRFSELPKSKQQSLTKNALSAQQTVKTRIHSKGIPMKYEKSFTTVVNGFSGKVMYKQIPEIEKEKGVKAVHIAKKYKRPIAKPQDASSNDLIHAPGTWKDYGYKGEGMTVAVIDTGIDVDHRDMVLSDSTDPALTKSKVNQLIQENHLPGKYYTKKVPYGYNYADENDVIKDNAKGASQHGMHVSGIVAANGDTDNGGIKGVAPEAQLLGMKVFSNDPDAQYTWSDIYVKAIDDAVKLGADAINMSLGSTASFVNPDDPDQVAIQNASENGVMVSISAGNETYFGNGYDLPYAANPDTGVVGSPSLAKNALSVASFENNELTLPAFTYSVDGGEGEKVPYMAASEAPDPSTIGKDEHEVVYVGLGRMPGDSEDHPEADDYKDRGIGPDGLKGKIALIQRGESSFIDKTLNAQKHGAIAAMIFNNADGYVSMASDPSIKIPQLFILKNFGDTLVNQLDNGKKVQIAFKGDEMQTPSPTAGQMSDFTSWGVTPNLDFKPEITAPGGNILSTLNNNSYGMMSGTSMAAPHVAGGSTLVEERVDKDFGVHRLARTQMTKNILMNTSRPQEDISSLNQQLGIKDIPYSPRRQGAGLMDLYAAMKTPVVATEVNSGEAKAALKEVGDSFTFTMEVKNYSGKPQVYQVDGDVQTDLADSTYDYMEAVGIVDGKTGKFPISFQSPHGSVENGHYQVAIPADGLTQIQVKVDLSHAVDGYFHAGLNELFPNGHFVEGFVKLTDPNDVNPELSFPYVGFHGDWNKAPILDEFIQNLDQSYYGVAGMLTDVGSDSYPYLGVDPVTGEPVKGHFAISPNKDGVQDNILPVLSLLRNAKEMKINILDQDKNKLKTLRSYHDVVKNFFDGGPPSGGLPYTIFDDAKWTGKVNGKVVKDGLYYYEIRTRIDYPNAKWQKKLVPVYVDTKKPKLKADYDEKTGTVHWDGKDKGSGIASYEVLVNNESVSDLLASDQDHYKLDKTSDIKSIKVVTTDWAGNQSVASAYEGEDHTIPDVHVEKPEPLQIFDKKQLDVSGHVADDSDIATFTINGKDVDLKWDSEKGYYTFHTTVKFDTDGQKAIEFRAVDDQGNEAKFERRILVDTTKPTLEIDAPSTTTNDKVTLKFKMADNFDQLRLTVNGDEIYNHEGERNEESDFSATTEYKASLKDGKNTFNVKLTDLAGHVVKKKVVVTKTDAEPVNSADDIKKLVKRYEDQGAFKDDSAVHALNLQLTTVSLYEKTGSAEKVVKHLENFKILLDRQKDNQLISDEAYQALKQAADTLEQKWQ